MPETETKTGWRIQTETHTHIQIQPQTGTPELRAQNSVFCLLSWQMGQKRRTARCGRPLQATLTACENLTSGDINTGEELA